MKVIFLDIDGAMATHNTMKVGWEYRNHGKNKKQRRSYSRFIQDKKTLSGKCIKTLNRLVIETQSKVVISSAWRYGTNTRYFQRLFRSKGFCGEIIGMTPDWATHKGIIEIDERGSEINLWLEWNKHKNIESYLVIDDEVSDIEPLHKGRFIHTNIDKGFQGEELLQEAIQKLKGEYNGSKKIS